MALIELACRSADCAPPPTGTGGSKKMSGGGPPEPPYRGIPKDYTDLHPRAIAVGQAIVDMAKTKTGRNKMTKHLGAVGTELGFEDNAQRAWQYLVTSVDGRHAISRTLRDPKPLPFMVEMLRIKHEEIEREMAGETWAFSRRLRRNPFEDEDLRNPFRPGDGPFSSLRKTEGGGTGVTSWWTPRSDGMRGSWSEYPDDTVTVDVSADQVLGRIGDMNLSGEILVANSPDVVARLKSGTFPLVPPENLVSSLIELACHTSACRPPTSGGTGGSSPKVGVISTRVPKAVGAESQVHGLSTILSDVPHAAVHGQAMAMIKKVPGFGHYAKMPGAKRGASEADQRALIDAMVDQVAENVVEVYDRSPNPEVTRRWYDAANSLAVDLAAEFGVDYEETAAVIAALSPSADWESNVALARHVLEVTTGPKALSATDVRAINLIAVQQYDKAMVSWQKNRMDKALATGKPESIAKAEASRPRPPEPLSRSVKSMDELSDTEMAYLVRHRGADGVPVQRMLLADKNGAPLVRPDGSVGYDLSQRATNDNGADTKIRWQSYPNLANAVSVIRDPSVENVSARLSQQHKVRAFYNNIAHPNSDQLDVTMDTHAFGIAFRIPVTVGHRLIASGPGGVYGTPSNAAAGTSGVHVMLGEGYRRAAAQVNARTGAGRPERPLLPREMQSVTWEQWRFDYPKETRTRKGTTQTTFRTEEIIQAADADPVSWPPDRVSEELAKIRAVTS